MSGKKGSKSVGQAAIHGCLVGVAAAVLFIFLVWQPGAGYLRAAGLPDDLIRLAMFALAAIIAWVVSNVVLNALSIAADADQPSEPSE